MHSCLLASFCLAPTGSSHCLFNFMCLINTASTYSVLYAREYAMRRHGTLFRHVKNVLKTVVSASILIFQFFVMHFSRFGWALLLLPLLPLAVCRPIFVSLFESHALRKFPTCEMWISNAIRKLGCSSSNSGGRQRRQHCLSRQRLGYNIRKT